jgi:hypothetical protein
MGSRRADMASRMHKESEAQCPFHVAGFQRLSVAKADFHTP